MIAIAKGFNMEMGSKYPFHESSKGKFDIFHYRRETQTLPLLSYIHFATYFLLWSSWNCHYMGINILFPDYTAMITSFMNYVYIPTVLFCFQLWHIYWHHTLLEVIPIHFHYLYVNFGLFIACTLSYTYISTLKV